MDFGGKKNVEEKNQSWTKTMIPNLTFASFSLLMVYSALSDLRSYTLPNFISIVLVVGFVLVLAVVQPSLTVIGWHLAVGGGVFIIGFTLFALGLLGGGDVKVIAALALWFGPNNFLAFFIMMTIIGGLLAIALMIFRRIPLSEAYLKYPAVRGLHDKNEGIPYGVAIAIAAVIEFPKTAIHAALGAL